ncbi:hypothetical protein ACETU7_13475 [Rhodococcus sp. 3Y1]
MPIRIVDPVTLEDVPVGTRGEVVIGGAHVMKRYWRNEAATAATMLDGDWLRTGDGGSFDEDGYLYLHDRLKDMIVSGGENVYPAEVESVLSGHPGIREVAVVGVHSDRWGETPLPWSFELLIRMQPKRRSSSGHASDWLTQAPQCSSVHRGAATQR